MEDIKETVYNVLSDSTNKIEELAKKRDEIESKIKSGNYSSEYIKNVLMPDREKAHKNLTNATDEAFNDAQNLINDYKKAQDESDRLNPDDLTDDIKLLQPGIVLLPRDIDAMLERNANNKTMAQIILRYAKANNIEVNKVYIATRDSNETAKALESILLYYRKWIDKPNAKDMLNKFFAI